MLDYSLRQFSKVGGVAQLVRALPCHGRGYGFEPRRFRHLLDRALSDARTDRRLTICALRS